jgi:hypothetical protein
MSDSDPPVSLYIAAYSDVVAAETDWDELEGLQEADQVKQKADSS